MLSWLSKLLRLDPLKEHDLQQGANSLSTTAMLRTVLLIILGINIPLTALTLFDLPASAPVVWLELATIGCCLLSLPLISRRPRLAGFILSAFIWLLFTSVSLWFSDSAPLSFSGHILGILVASLALGSRAGFLYIVLSLVSSGIVIAARGLGLQPLFDFADQPVYLWLGSATIFSANAMLLSLTFRGLQHALEDARRSQSSAERRAVQLQVAAEVASETVAIYELDLLLARAANLIREKFGFYHAGIFLLSDDGKHMLLKAAGGDAGQRLVQNGYSLPVGGVSIVGTVAASGQRASPPTLGWMNCTLRIRCCPALAPRWRFR